MVCPARDALSEAIGQSQPMKAAAAGAAVPAAGLVGGHVPLTRDTGELAGQFARALEAVYMVYQPIVDGRDGRIFGLEALVRSSAEQLSHPGPLFDAAEQLGGLRALGRRIRDAVAQDVATLPPQAVGPVFVNLHTRDLLDEALYDPKAALSRHAHRVVLEITERHALEEVDDVGRRVGELRALGYRVAVDDLGAGYAGLTMLTTLEPEVVKLDMALVRGVERSLIKRKVLAALAELCRDLKILVIAEGIETLAEREILLQLGIDYLQGYYFGRPERRLPLLHEVHAFRWPTIERRELGGCGCRRSERDVDEAPAAGGLGAKAEAS